METIVLIPFAPILVESTRSIGYSFESAVADIVDNSVSANAKNVWVDFKNNNEHPYVAILDDGFGMTEDELINSMRYGSKSSKEVRSENDLGRFGLGLKMASMSQCRQLTVFSKKNNKCSGARWDLDHIIKSNDWSLIKMSKSDVESTLIDMVEKLNEIHSGTVIIWQKFDRVSNVTNNLQKTLDKKLDITSEHISLVFHRYLNPENPKRKLNIFFNERRLEGYDPFLLDNPATQKYPDQFITIEKKKIPVKYFILPYESKLKSKDKQKLNDFSNLRLNQGFYIYRNERLIIWGTWFRISSQNELFKLARIRVDIPNSLDHIWEIDIKKSTATLPDLVKNELETIVKETIGKSKNVYQYRGRKIRDDDITHSWEVLNNRGEYQYKINRFNPILLDLEDSLSTEDKNLLNAYLKILEDTFPFQDLYLRMAQSEKGSVEITEDEVLERATQVIQKIESINGNVQECIKSLMQIDYFRVYPKVIEKLKKEYSHEQ